MSIPNAPSSSLRPLILPTLVAALGGLLFGYDLSVIAGANDALKLHFGLGEAQVGFVGSSAILGCIPGALLAGFLGDKLGRKKSLLLTAVLYIISAAWSAYPTEFLGVSGFHVFLTARFLNGLAVGAASMICPTYISELAPKKHRGWLGTLFQLGIVTGIFVVFFCIQKFNAYGEGIDKAAGAAADTWLNDKGWRYLLLSEAIPATPFLFLLLPIPESPRWLLQIGKEDKAKTILTKLLGHEEAEAEIRDIKAANTVGEAPFSHLFSKVLRRPLVIACGLAIFCQFCGMNAIMYYAPKVFQSGAEVAAASATAAEVAAATAAAKHSAYQCAVWVGLVNLLFTFVAIFCIDLIGRRPLLLIGSFFQFLMLGITGWMYHKGYRGSDLLLPILGFIASFAMAMGPLPWVVISEIFPGNIRGRAISVGIGTVWVACYLLALTFPAMRDGFGKGIHETMFKDLAVKMPFLEKGLGLDGTFFIYASVSLISFFFVLFLVPETKGRTLEEISSSWSKK